MEATPSADLFDKIAGELPTPNPVASQLAVFKKWLVASVVLNVLLMCVVFVKYLENPEAEVQLKVPGLDEIILKEGDASHEDVIVDSTKEDKTQEIELDESYNRNDLADTTKTTKTAPKNVISDLSKGKQTDDKKVETESAPVEVKKAPIKEVQKTSESKSDSAKTEELPVEEGPQKTFYERQAELLKDSTHELFREKK